jgi:flagellar biosynthetic protein FlhB
MSGDKHDKTEAPTAKRKKEARRDGQVVRSEDLVTWTSVLIGTIVMPGMVSRTGSAVTAVLRSTVELAHNPDAKMLPTYVGRAMVATLGAILPAMLALLVIAILGNLAQVGLLLTGKPLKPQMSRLSPFKGIKRIFSVQSLWSTLTATMKLGIILAVSWVMVRGTAADIVRAPFRNASQAVHATAMSALALVRAIAAAALVVGLADYAFQRRKQAKDLKMSKHEIKQEARESEGDPHMKGKRRQMQNQMSRNRMLAAIPSADVIITNPTHFAIAIEYQRALGAPKVIARGADGLAQRIKAEGAAAGVPLVEAKPLARALYAVCRVGEEIPPELYQGVATVLAFLHQLSATRRTFGGPIGLEVPDTWTPSGSELVRVPPARRRMLEKREAEEAAAAADAGGPRREAAVG